MARIEALLLKKDARSALRRLGAAGTLELMNSAPGPDTAPSRPADNRRAIAGCLELLSRLEALRRETGAAGDLPAPGAELDYAAAAAVVEESERGAAALLELRRGLSAEAVRLSGESGRLSVYAGLQLPRDGSGFNFLYCSAGSVPVRSLPALRAGLQGNAVLVQLAEKNGRRHIAALAGRRDGAGLAAALAAAGFRPEALTAGPGATLGEKAAYYSAEAGRVKEALKRAEAEISSFMAGAADQLTAAERAVATEARLLEAEQAMPRTASSVFVSGWAPAEEADGIARVMSAISDRRCAVETTSAKPGSGAPVLLRPPRLLRPFAALVTGYGLPRYGETDPTVFSALSFLFMFGMMFGDAGHGAVLCLAGIILARGRLLKRREAGRAVLACGLSSVLFGLVYGSYFGVEQLKKYALWRDPLAGDPLALAAAAVLTGAAVISLGVILNIVNRVRLGDGAGAALDRFGAAGLAFYWAALLLAAGRAGGGFALPVMGAAVVCWTLKGPLLYLIRRRSGGTKEGEEGFIAVTAEAMAGAFEGALLYLANTVSFVRLAAYALSHAALLAAAWALRDAADRAWGENSLAGLAAVILGNAAAIGFEGLVAAVQALRLEYYEFFGKFFEGGGRPFRPFTFKT